MAVINNNILQNSYDGLNCIWMASGNIDYSLCEKDFNCDECPLDKIMRNLFPGEGKAKDKNYNLSDTEFIDKIICRIENSCYDSKLIYLKYNLVIKHIFSNIYYLGLNPIILSLLDNISSIKEYMKRIYFIKDQKIMDIEGEWGSYAVNTPVNFLLLDKLNWTPEDIISRSWIALVLLNQQEISDGKLSCNVWHNEQLKMLKLLNEYKNCCLKINSIPVNKGEKINSFYQLIGESEYIKMLNCSCDE